MKSTSDRTQGRRFWPVTRRGVLQTGAGASLMALADKVTNFMQPARANENGRMPPQTIRTSLTVNGQPKDPDARRAHHPCSTRCGSISA